MGIIDDARDLADLVKKVGDLDLYRRIVELQGQVVELQGRNVTLEKELAEARSVLSRRSAMVYRAPYYWVDGDDTPFCPKCWDANQLQVRLPPLTGYAAGDGRQCNNCNTMYWEKRGSSFFVTTEERWDENF